MRSHLVEKISLLLLSARFTAGKPLSLQSGSADGIKHSFVEFSYSILSRIPEANKSVLEDVKGASAQSIEIVSLCVQKLFLTIWSI
jgi:hypothetical protein